MILFNVIPSGDALCINEISFSFISLLAVEADGDEYEGLSSSDVAVHAVIAHILETMKSLEN